MANIIRSITAREILDSRGNPTVEAKVVLENGIIGAVVIALLFFAVLYKQKQTECLIEAAKFMPATVVAPEAQMGSCAITIIGLLERFPHDDAVAPGGACAHQTTQSECEIWLRGSTNFWQCGEMSFQPSMTCDDIGAWQMKFML